MKLSVLLLPAVLAFAGLASCSAQQSCSVRDYGARGDCASDDTAAFQHASDSCGSFHVPRSAPGGCYRINGVNLHSGATVTLEDRNTEIRPTSPNTPYVFGVSGTHSAQISYVTIRNGILWAPFSMAQETAGIRIDHANHIKVEETIVNGFYDDIYADNTNYLYLLHAAANGASHANLWHQHSGEDAGYFGGPLYIEQSTLDSCQCSAASIWLQDISVVNITDSDIVGVTDGQGLHADSSNGLHASSPDYPAGIHIHGDTFDSIASEPIWIQNYIKSDMVGTWVSGGRTHRKSCIVLGDGVRDFSINETHVFWCGLDGLDLKHATAVKVGQSTFSGSPQIGIHNQAATRSAFIGNTCDAHTFNGNGSSAQKYCIYEEPAAKGNSYLANDGASTAHGNVYRNLSTVSNMP